MQSSTGNSSVGDINKTTSKKNCLFVKGPSNAGKMLLLKGTLSEIPFNAIISMLGNERIPLATHDREQSGLLRQDAMWPRTNRDDEIALWQRTHSSAHITSRTRHRQSHAIHSHRKQRPVVDDAADGGPRGIEEPNDNL